MLFNSADFWAFAAIFFGLWALLRQRDQRRWALLTIASFIFYGWWDWRFLFLIVASGLIDFTAALWMVRAPDKRKLLLLASLVANLGLLGFFKYTNFALENVRLLLNSALGLGLEVPRPSIILPVGISFFTFQSMSYTIDVYRGRLQPTPHILHFFAYLSMFPQLVAGPIVRASDLLPQLEQARPASAQMRWDGLQLIVHGMFKKVVIADNLAAGIDGAFSGPHVNEPLYWWLATFKFGVQIYCDFSGYSDIACGLAKWMGYEFPRNFNHPYVASSFREFWARWHISLSSWFRDYVYIPLGGSRVSRGRAHANMWVTMLLSGLWHGASWNFALWGALHATYLSVEREVGWSDRLAKYGMVGRAVATAVVVAFAMLAWVPFRAETLAQTAQIMGTMMNLTRLASVTHTATSLLASKFVLLILAGFAARELFWFLRLERFVRVEARWYRLTKPVALVGMIFASVYLRGSGQDFIYFQF